MSNDFKIEGIFPIPVYCTHKKSGLDSTEKKEIENIIEEGMWANEFNSTSQNISIFDTRLYNLKEFCEKHIKTCVKEIISPIEELSFYITQSWLNITKPGENHHKHWHSNSIISGVFYVSTTENDSIRFHDPNVKLKEFLKIGTKKFNPANSGALTLRVNDYDLFLFPSWLEHDVQRNEYATTDRISISFNSFAKGTFGDEKEGNKLIL